MADITAQIQEELDRMSPDEGCDQCGLSDCETGYLCQVRRYYASNPHINNESQYSDKQVYRTDDPRLKGKKGFSKARGR